MNLKIMVNNNFFNENINMQVNFSGVNLNLIWSISIASKFQIFLDFNSLIDFNRIILWHMSLGMHD